VHRIVTTLLYENGHATEDRTPVRRAGGNESRNKADVKALYEIRERGEAEGKAYIEMLFAKCKAYREGIATRREAIRYKIYKLRSKWAKLDSDLEKRKADILKAYEEKRIAERKADQERRETYEKMMAEWKADQERGKAERKAY
jgi:hypothetical protein